MKKYYESMRNERKGIAMRRQKSYCIIKKDGNVYFPIKAKLGPYYGETGELKTGYLAGMPNFFGGTVEGDKDIYFTLINEVSQESQKNIKINLSDTDNKEEQRNKIMGACVLLESFTFGRENSTEYYFYSFNADDYQPTVTIEGFEGSNMLRLSTDTKWEEKYREMSCILKIPVSQLLKEFDNFLDKCIETGREYLLDKGTITTHRDWNDDGTQNAFRAFCTKYGIDAIH
ncbi:MAG: hypothetical protein NC131_10120 [Roseburia sp.]|nr:hypothetical protein [Roseburia sp.]